jgi:hypothetical protein
MKHNTENEIKPFANILITERDKDILRILNRLKISESKILRLILSPETSQNTFTSRLLKLEEKWYIHPINPDRARNQHKIYGLTTDMHKLKEIEHMIWEKTEEWRYTHSHMYFYHTLYISYLLCYLIQRFRKKNPAYIFNVKDFVSQFAVQRYTNMRDETVLIQSREKHMIPDGLLTYWDTHIWLEVERTNSNKQFKEKMKWYEEQSYYLNSIWFSDFFEPKKKHTIVVMTPFWKIWAYKQILEEVKIEDIYGINFVDEGSIIDSFQK